MSDRTSVTDLLAAALQQAADVARGRLDRDVQVVESALPESSAILRFDLPFTAGGKPLVVRLQRGRHRLLGHAHRRLRRPRRGAHRDAPGRAHRGVLATCSRARSTASPPVSTSRSRPRDIDLGMEAALPGRRAGRRPAPCSAWRSPDSAPSRSCSTSMPTLTRFLTRHAVAQLATIEPAAPAPVATVGGPDAVADDSDDQPTPAGPPGGASNVVPLPSRRAGRRRAAVAWRPRTAHERPAAAHRGAGQHPAHRARARRLRRSARSSSSASSPATRSTSRSTTASSPAARSS